ncbi:MAG: hypothetical protein KAJ44_03245 [Thermoplasmatales archaeon]|nr:hypothetical protein [Thermoplasmatales archaeon]
MTGDSGKTKNTKRKILIVNFLAALILTVPFISVAQEGAVEKLKLEEHQELAFDANDNQPGLLKLIRMMAEYLLELLTDENIVYNQALVEKTIYQYVTGGEELESIKMTTLDVVGKGGAGSASTLGTDGRELLFDSEGLDGSLSIEAEESNGELDFVASDGNIYIYLAGDVFDSDNPFDIEGRLGWLNGIIEFNYLRKQLKEDIRYNFTPNVTWAEVIEETLGWFGYEFDVEEFLDNLEVALMEKFAAYPLVLSFVPIVIENISSMLNSRVSWVTKQWMDVKLRLREFVQSFLKSFFERNLRPFRAFLRLIVSTFKFSLAVGAMILYTNATEKQEWIIDLTQSIVNWKNAWFDFINWLTSKPWLEPIYIHGNVTGLDPEELGGVSVRCKSGEVYTNEDGFFDGLNFTTVDEQFPWGIHECVVTAITTDGDEITVDGLLQTGAFSDGILNLTIDFQAENNNVFVQLQGNKASQEAEGAKEKTELELKEQKEL